MILGTLNRHRLAVPCRGASLHNQISHPRATAGVTSEYGLNLQQAYHLERANKWSRLPGIKVQPSAW